MKTITHINVMQYPMQKDYLKYSMTQNEIEIAEGTMLIFLAYSRSYKPNLIKSVSSQLKFKYISGIGFFIFETKEVNGVMVENLVISQPITHIADVVVFMFRYYNINISREVLLHDQAVNYQAYQYASRIKNNELNGILKDAGFDAFMQ